ncbi:Fe2+-dependent dioxygenase [Lysobacteraceae bacterium NML120232]|nr:Fe2+-dependent dioxygenase [Xanthomonadaceae bacterium NML08-0793]PJK13793.1 Fe2+-dependent dioxygenase [Xanthomonadaceae bacterium NML120232]
MMLVIPDLLDRATTAQLRAALATAPWQDGRATAGYIARGQKRNQQLAPDSALAQTLGRQILDALSQQPLFISFALPLKTLSPMFNRYHGGGEYGLHIDNALRIDPISGERIRTDISTTVFLNDPDDYDGGELIIQDSYGSQQVKLPAGHAVVYPGSSLHQVTPVTRGERLASFFWSQSMIQDDSLRSTLFELDQSIQQLALRDENLAEVTRLTGVYHNLLRRFGDV